MWHAGWRAEAARTNDCNGGVAEGLCHVELSVAAMPGFFVISASIHLPLSCFNALGLSFDYCNRTDFDRFFSY